MRYHYYQVPNAILTSGGENTITVTCINNGYELIGQSSITCEICMDISYEADSVMCKGPSFEEGGIPECRLRSGNSSNLDL